MLDGDSNPPLQSCRFPMTKMTDTTDDAKRRAYWAEQMEAGGVLIGWVELFFGVGDDGGYGGVAGDVDGGAAHVEDAVDGDD